MRTLSSFSTLAKVLILAAAAIGFHGKAVAQEALHLGINQGLSEPLTAYDRHERYQAFSDYISTALNVRSASRSSSMSRAGPAIRKRRITISHSCARAAMPPWPYAIADRN